MARATKAGVDGVHLHRLRHRWAHRALAAGMAEGDLMRLGGWTTTNMLHRVYGAGWAVERAVESAHRLKVGDAF